jgi:hypothetical protein
MELHEALTQITEIRLQMARTEVFRGFRAIPAAFSGAVAIAAAMAQMVLIQDAEQQIHVYLWLWIGAAVVSVLSAVLEMAIRARNASSPLTREITSLAMEQFIPSVVAGALMTLVLVRSAPHTVWMLPGLWQVLYSLGIFASCRLLPRAMFGVAVFYLFTGLTTLAVAQGGRVLNPWAMGIPFGVGQLLAAAVLYRTLERDHDPA